MQAIRILASVAGGVVLIGTSISVLKTLVMPGGRIGRLYMAVGRAVDQVFRLAVHRVPGYERRHQVRPGLTGIAQVFAARDVPRRRKFRYDLLYIRRRSFWLDLRLIALSFWITGLGRWDRRSPKI